MSSRDIFSIVWPLAEEVAHSLGFEVVEIERGGGRGRMVIRLFIDKPDGVAVGDCSRMSRELSMRLEEEDLIESSYVLEVSSPGLERPLRKAVDFERFSDSPVEIRLFSPDGESGRKQFTGTLLGIEGETVTIKVEGGEKRSFSLGEISRARLRVDWDTVFQDKPQSGEVKDGGLHR
ncbi:MAG: ribosome maturation factor RimP [Nitrospinaceae bacterium]|nr:ribosome maturation factor RimP [Nitrospinaceae bacterium]MBT3433146.1 ribosome maturation factor RimP [Nitrospinaceae bacterium]MBT3821928.1 ribosome maturation factor RimP [Nitrospinaceae bacterium]MBT4095488.1 ribosome maturation factor RimP [Nitrospinaceae bacterium]MBT4429462.1 ribosome maturation factor RimP [Nitrospinaceae bacterium]